MSCRRIMASWLLAMAMAVAGLIPHGYMPQLDADSGILEMVICTADGAVTIRLGPDGEPVDEDAPSTDHTKPHVTCQFGVNSVPMASAQDAIMTPMAHEARDAAPIADHQRQAESQSIHALSARGPPTSA